MPAQMPEGLCPRCLLAPSLTSADTFDGSHPSDLRGEATPFCAEDWSAPATDPSLPRVPHYRVLRLIGDGGIGEVYEAEQEHPRRTVAL
jgi:hypothetical protein